MRLLAALLGVAVSVAVAAPPSRSATTPKLRLVSPQPLVVRGEGFRPAERVVVTALTLSGPKRVVVLATATGRFGATFRLAGQPCGKAFAVGAVGGRGSRATLRLAGTACVPPPIE